MKEKLFKMVMVLALLMMIPVEMGCPDPVTGQVDPYLTARTIILQANTALAMADGIFGQWLLGQADAEKVKKAQNTYVVAKSGVANGLQIALNGVNIAENAKKEFDIKLLMAEANKAWTSLRAFLEELFKSEVPTTQPAVKVATTDGVTAIRAKLKLIKKPTALKNLPKSLIPPS